MTGLEFVMVSAIRQTLSTELSTEDVENSQVRSMNAHPTGRFDKTERLHAIMDDGGISDCGNARNCIKTYHSKGGDRSRLAPCPSSP